MDESTVDRTTATALEWFDALPAVGVEEMEGTWRGSGVPTGHRLDGVLEATGWHGKRFVDAESVDPLVMYGRDGTFAVDPRLVPMGLLLRFAPVVRGPAGRVASRVVLPLLRTTRPAARLRMVEYRGVVTATMVYDAHPIHDHFRRLDDDSLLGLMDMRGFDAPFFFRLDRG